LPDDKPVVRLGGGEVEALQPFELHGRFPESGAAGGRLDAADRVRVTDQEIDAEHGRAPCLAGGARSCAETFAFTIYGVVGANPPEPVEHGAAPFIPWGRGVSLDEAALLPSPQQLVSHWLDELRRHAAEPR
jgi:hypothetical protein